MPTPSFGSPLVRAPESGAPTIVHITSEYSPFARSGGLAEAVMGLANVQVKGGANVVVFLPLYRTVRDYAPDLAPLGRPISVDLGYRSEEVRFFREVHAPKGPKVVFVDIPSAFARGGLYGENGHDYTDNARRFALFSRAVLDAIPRLISGPVLVHAHDWHASLALLYMRTYAELRERFERAAVRSRSPEDRQAARQNDEKTCARLLLAAGSGAWTPRACCERVVTCVSSRAS